MNEQKIVKFNLVMSCVLLGILVLMLVGATFAYFADHKQINNTFVSGNVRISLSEAAVKPDDHGNLIEDTDKARIFGNADATVNNYGRVYPGQSIYKDPLIVNTGGDDAWIAAKVTFTDGTGNLTKIMGYEGYEDIDIEVLLSGGLLDEEIHFGEWNGIEDVCHNDNYAMIQISDASDGKYEFYFLMLKPLHPGESVVIFDHVIFPDEWSSNEMQELANLKIHIEAFGVQTMDLDSCLEAMTEAFPEQFDID
jgi:predicted ribosomally synthesized peptide with SipW-like signal peptide